jgi:aminomethyltransferase
MLFKDNKVARTQHNAIRNNAGWYKWTHDLLEVTGADAAGFLDSIYVNSVAKAPIGRSKYTTMLDEEGRIIDDVIVSHIGENCFWVSTLYLPELVKWIDVKKGNFSVKYRDITHETEMYAVQGPASGAMVNKIVGESVDGMKYFSIKDNTIGKIKVKIHRSGFTGELGYEIYCKPKDDLAVEKALTEAGAEFKATKITVLEVAVRSVPCEKGFVLRQDIFGLNPFEADMGWAVDMSKEFIGKAAVAKVKKEGPKRRLVGLEFDTSYNDINQGEIVKVNGVKVGTVTAAIYGYTIDKYIGYAVVDRVKALIGTEVKVGINNVPAKIVDRIWYDPEGKRARA